MSFTPANNVHTTLLRAALAHNALQEEAVNAATVSLHTNDWSVASDMIQEALDYGATVKDIHLSPTEGRVCTVIPVYLHDNDLAATANIFWVNEDVKDYRNDRTEEAV